VVSLGQKGWESFFTENKLPYSKREAHKGGKRGWEKEMERKERDGIGP
jgi:hypothetical protein